MTHPIVAAKSALVVALKNAVIGSTYESKVDVFNRKSAAYSEYIAVCLGSATADIERATMATTRARYEETWSVEAFIYPNPGNVSNVAFDSNESETIVADLMDLYQSYLAEHYRLGGVESLVRCEIASLEILDQEDSDGTYGRIVFFLEFRKTR